MRNMLINIMLFLLFAHTSLSNNKEWFRDTIKKIDDDNISSYRLLFIWVAGDKQQYQDKIYIGDSQEESEKWFINIKILLDAVKEVFKDLKNIKNFKIELLTDDITYKTQKTQLDELLKEYNDYFKITYIDDDKVKDSVPKELNNAFAHGKEGNPAIFSDMMRIFYLPNKEFALNIYLDIDNFIYFFMKNLDVQISRNKRNEQAIEEEKKALKETFQDNLKEMDNKLSHFRILFVLAEWDQKEHPTFLRNIDFFLGTVDEIFGQLSNLKEFQIEFLIDKTTYEAQKAQLDELLKKYKNYLKITFANDDKSVSDISIEDFQRKFSNLEKYEINNINYLGSEIKEDGIYMTAVNQYSISAYDIYNNDYIIYKNPKDENVEKIKSNAIKSFNDNKILLDHYLNRSKFIQGGYKAYKEDIEKISKYFTEQEKAIFSIFECIMYTFGPEFWKQQYEKKYVKINKIGYYISAVTWFDVDKKGFFKPIFRLDELKYKFPDYFTEELSGLLVLQLNFMGLDYLYFDKLKNTEQKKNFMDLLKSDMGALILQIKKLNEPTIRIAYHQIKGGVMAACKILGVNCKN